MVNLSLQTYRLGTIEQILAFAGQIVRHSGQRVFLYLEEFDLVLRHPRTVVLAVNRPVDSLAYCHDIGPFRADCRLNGYVFQTEYDCFCSDFEARAIGL